MLLFIYCLSLTFPINYFIFLVKGEDLMKKIILSLSILGALALTGCASKVVEKTGCCANVEQVEIVDGPYIENRITIFDMRPKPPEVHVVPSMVIDAKVLFAFNKSVLTPEGKKLIAILADSTSRNLDKPIQLVGSTDFFGTDAYNSKLAQKRAIVVRDEFIKNGIPANMMSLRTHLNPKDQEVIDECKGSLKDCVAPDRNTSMLIKLDM